MGGGMDKGKRRRPVTAGVLFAAGLLVLTGCSGSIQQPVSKAVEQSSSAAASAALAVGLKSAGKATAALTSTTVQNMRDEALKAYRQAASMEAPDDSGLALQQQVLAAMAGVLPALQDVQRALKNGDTTARDKAVSRLQKLAEDLRRLGDQLRQQS